MNKTTSRFRIDESNVSSLLLLLGVFLAFISLVLFMHWHGFDFYVSDISGYLHDSDNILRPYNPFHIAGYAITIAAIRFLTFDILPPILSLWIITYVATAISGLIIWRFSSREGNLEDRVMLVAAFVLWPLTGLPYVVYPVADALAICVLLVAWYYYSNKNILGMVVALAFAPLCHKIMWLIVPLVWIGFLSSQKGSMLKKYSVYSLLIILPLGALWYGGSQYYGTSSWLFSTINSAETTAHSSFWPLVGAITLVQMDGPAGVWKVILCLLPVALAGTTLYYSWKRRLFDPFVIGVSLSLIILFLFASPNSLWDVARFGKIIVPALLIIPWRLQKRVLRPALYITTILLLWVSQFFYALYMITYFGFDL